MHELGVMRDVLSTAVRAADENGAAKVTKITLKVGVLSGILPNFMQEYFDVISKDTKAENAQLVIETEPAIFHCTDCSKKTVYEKFGPDFSCEHCSGNSIRLLHGKTFQIVSVAVI